MNATQVRIRAMRAYVRGLKVVPLLLFVGTLLTVFRSIGTPGTVLHTLAVAGPFMIVVAALLTAIATAGLIVILSAAEPISAALGQNADENPGSPEEDSLP